MGNKACQQYRKVLYLPAAELFDRITIAERTGDRITTNAHATVLQADDSMRRHFSQID